MDEAIALGRYVPSPGAAEGLRVLCDAPELEAHAARPWFRAHLAERLDVSLRDAEGPPAGAARVDGSLLARHACVFGATGSGKTRLALHLVVEQVSQGCSVVMLDPKAETLRHLLCLAHAAGVGPEEVTLLSPALAGAGAPGWNPLDGRSTGLSPAQAAADLVAVLSRSTDSWGPRLQDILTNALILVAAHGLSLFELARLLQREDYREGLLRVEPDPGTRGDPLVFSEARDFFAREFAGWTRGEKASAAAPVLNKIREFLRNPFLRALLSARRNTLDLAGLWKRRGLVLVHLDSVALGDEGARLLGGLLAHGLLRTAMKASGPVPVVLALDEMGINERFVGAALADTLAVARSRNLRLLVACQHLAQLSEGLRAALLANCAVRAFFRLGHADAKPVAASLAAGTGETVSKVAADVAKRDGEGSVEAWCETGHVVRDGRGLPLKLSPGAWAAFRDVARTVRGGGQVDALKKLARVSGVDRLYVHAADTKEPAELCGYVRGLDGDHYELRGPAPLRLVVAFPRPRLSVLSRVSEAERERAWVKALSTLAPRHAVLRLPSGPPGVVRVTDVPDADAIAGAERLLSAAVARAGQSAKEIEQTYQSRAETVEHVAGTTGGTETDRQAEAGAARRPLDGEVSVRETKTALARGTRRRPTPPEGGRPLRSAGAEAAGTKVKVIEVGTVAEDGSLA